MDINLPSPINFLAGCFQLFIIKSIDKINIRKHTILSELITGIYFFYHYAHNLFQNFLWDNEKYFTRIPANAEFVFGS